MDPYRDPVVMTDAYDEMLTVEENIVNKAVQIVKRGAPRPRVVRVSLDDFHDVGRRLFAKIETSPYGEWIRIHTAVGQLDLVPSALLDRYRFEFHVQLTVSV